MNYMSEVAKMLGVEIGEEFEINGYKETFKFDVSGTYYKQKHCVWYPLRSLMIEQLLTGIIEIKRKPRKPKFNDKYYVPHPCGLYNDLAISQTWTNHESDLYWFERGAIFRTKEEAVEAAKKMLKALEEIK